MSRRFTPEQLELINSPRDMVEIAKWVLTNKKPGPAARKVLAFAGLGHQREPHNLMVSYIGNCIPACGGWMFSGYHPENEALCQLLNEYIAYQADNRS